MENSQHDYFLGSIRAQKRPSSTGCFVWDTAGDRTSVNLSIREQSNSRFIYCATPISEIRKPTQ